MGVKDLWSVLTPYCERKPINELQGKVVAIDLAGWVCESLNVVDYFVHPRQYLKNLFFRTCYLLLEGVTPVFVLEGKAPKLKEQTISKRNGLQFRGVKPRNNPQPQSVQNKASSDAPKGRTRFNHVLKQCESLLESLGIQCVQAPGEAEAYCAFLNKNGVVDGVISQDSDCFAYGAKKVYRNFSVSTQGSASAHGGAVDVYDINKVKTFIDFGQNKIIAMALLCGCDYCPDGVEGVGKDGMLKLFARYKDDDILNRIQSWRSSDLYYTSVEMKVNDNNVCANCGHLGKTQSHSKNGCGLCRTSKGCDESLWREERLSLKAELTIRKKALAMPDFPSQEIISEFLSQPQNITKLDLQWKQPNLIKFVRTIGKLLQWTDIYCFQKFLPLLTRWHIIYHGKVKPTTGYLVPKYIKKKRTLKGVPSYEIVWEDVEQFFKGLIPDEELTTFLYENPTGIETLWSTIEPIKFVEHTYPELIKVFEALKVKPKSKAKSGKGRKMIKEKTKVSDSLQDMSGIIKATEEIAEEIKKKKNRTEKEIQKLDKFIVHKESGSLLKKALLSGNCSTPKNDSFTSNLESESECDFNMSEIINCITSKPAPLKRFSGKKLKYENRDFCSNANRSKDDLDTLLVRRNRSMMSPEQLTKKPMLSTSLELLENCLSNYEHSSYYTEQVCDFMAKNNFPDNPNKEQSGSNVSYFFGSVCDGNDDFEKSLHINFRTSADEDDYALSDSSS